MAVPVRDVPHSGPLRRVVASIVTLLLTTGILIAVPSVAFAADTVINFDNLSSNTVVSSQYAAQGVTFDQTPSGPIDFMPRVLSDPGAHSPPNVLDIEQGGFCGLEANRVELWARFAAPRNHVSMFVGDLQSLAGERVTLSGFDLNGTAIPAATDTVTTSGGRGVHTLLQITDPNSQISFFHVQGPPDAVCVAVDDLGFDAVPAGIGPDFGLSALASSATVIAGGSQVVPLVLHRTATSTGPISLVVSGLPQGVSASLNPNPVNGGDGTPITLTLTAAANAPPAVNIPVTVTGTPSPSAGPQQRSVTIPVSVSGTFDLRAQGIDVTQGIQRDAGLLVPSGAGFPGRRYLGVDLVAGKKTVVRFFADAHGAPQGIPGVGAKLHGFRNGVELPGSPLSPEYGPGTSSTGTARLPDTGEADPAAVFRAELTSNQNAFTFTLPDSWASGTIQLVADVVPPLPSFTGPQVIECQSPSCLANNSFTLNGVTFHPTGGFELNTIALTVNGTNPVPADQVFTDAKAVAPLAEVAGPGPGPHFVVFPYEATLDVSSLINGGGPNVGQAVEGVVAQWDANNAPPSDGTIGITPTGTNGSTFGRDSEADFTPNSSSGNDRPLTSVAHELFHQFGLPHASNECGGGQDNDSDDQGQTGEPWLPLAQAPSGEPNVNPPDDGIGQLDGIGLDTTSEPYTILADGLNGISQYYDFMSYCSATRGFGDSGNWVSPQNWEAVFHNAHFGGAAPQRAATASSQGGPLTWVAALDPAQLRVIGFVSSSGQVQLTSVGPQVGPRLPSPKGAASGLTLVARGPNGKTLASVPMTRTPGHVDQAGDFDEITGTVPASGAESIAVEAYGKVLASRVRPARAPRVQVLAPTSGARAGAGPTVLVQWSAASPEHLPLTASVDYSDDGGRSWRTIFIGADRGRVSLPSFYFPGSRDGRVRVRVNDGFNETAAVSAAFTAAGAPPQVSIVSPGPRTQLSGDATLQLAGEAFDQQLRSLSGHSLQWFDGAVPLGSGATISAGPLPPGANRIRLVARDAAGRTASATIVVNVTPVKVPFLNLTIPARVSSRASQLTLLASSAVPAKLTISGRSFDLTRTPKRLIVPIMPGQSPLLLELRATANGTSTPFAAEITRAGAG